MKLEKSHKQKMAAEERASGISPEHTELDEALQDIMERSEGHRMSCKKGRKGRKRMQRKKRKQLRM